MSETDINWICYIQYNFDLVTLNLGSTYDLVTIYYIKSFDLVTLCDFVTVFGETKSVTKSRLHCTDSFFYIYPTFLLECMKWWANYTVWNILSFAETNIMIFFRGLQFLQIRLVKSFSKLALQTSFHHLQLIPITFEQMLISLDFALIIWKTWKFWPLSSVFSQLD